MPDVIVILFPNTAWNQADGAVLDSDDWSSPGELSSLLGVREAQRIERGGDLTHSHEHFHAI